MRLGLNVGYWGLGMTAEDQLALVKEAEAAGYDSVWAAEAYGSDAATVLAWLAAQTSQIKIGSAIFQMPARAHARVRGDPAPGAVAGAARVRGRDVQAAAARRSRQGTEADDRAGAGADTDLHRVDRAEEHGAHRRDRRR